MSLREDSKDERIRHLEHQLEIAVNKLQVYSKITNELNELKVSYDVTKREHDSLRTRIERLEMELQASRAGHRTTQGCYETEQSARIMAERERDALSAELVRRTRILADQPDFKTFVDLKYGIVGTILSALQDGQISRGKAAEALAEVAHGVTPQLPDNLPAPLPEDCVPSEVLRERDALRAQVAQLREALRKSTDLAVEAAKADYAMGGSEDPATGLATKSAVQRAKNKWKAYDDCVDAALAATPADSAAWLERQRKLAAADALDGRAQDFDAMADIQAMSFGKAVLMACAANCRECAAQLRKEAGDGE